MIPWQEIADELVGTSGWYDHGYCEEHGITHDELVEGVSEMIFSCECCGWWVELEEMNDDNGEQVCTECLEQRDEEAE